MMWELVNLNMRFGRLHVNTELEERLEESACFEIILRAFPARAQEDHKRWMDGP
jgi:hypothetical protein